MAEWLNSSFILKLRSLYHSKKFLWGLAGLGMVLHLSQYFFNRSLSVDEAALALNILNRSFAELLQPLSSNQAAPLGFLFGTKFLVLLFGSSEYVLRLIPFASAILSLVLFVKIVSYFLPSSSASVALALFATSDWLIYYSSSLKQYSSDVFVALLLFWVCISLLSSKKTARHILHLGLIGAVCVWCSHPSVFTLGGLGSCLLVYWWGRKAWTNIRWLLLSILLWVISFGGLYLVSLRKIAMNQYLQQFWTDRFMPLIPSSLSDVLWFVKNFFETFEYLLGIPSSQSFFNILAQIWGFFQSFLGLSPSAGLPFHEIGRGIFSGFAFLSLYILAACALCCGCLSLWKKNKLHFWLLLSPIVLTLLASGLHRYPFAERLILFLRPAQYLLLGAGIIRIYEKVRRIWPIAGTILVFALCVYPVSYAGYYWVHPRQHEESRPVLRYLQEHRQPGDMLYVYHASEEVFQYYDSRFNFGFDEQHYIQGIASREDWNRYVQDVQQVLGHQRAWFFFSHSYAEEQFYLYILDAMGTRLDAFRDFRASIYLYDLR